MPRLPQKYRSLYLLALFQLVGGPLVLLPVILLSKLSVKHVAEHGLTAGINQAWQSEEWQAAVDGMLHENAALPGTAKDRAPDKAKDSQGKWFATDLEQPASAPGSVLLGSVRWERADLFAATRSQAPPGPPPRWA